MGRGCRRAPGGLGLCLEVRRWSTPEEGPLGPWNEEEDEEDVEEEVEAEATPASAEVKPASAEASPTATPVIEGIQLQRKGGAIAGKIFF